MPRRRVVAAREILPDPKFSSQTIAKFMNHVMQDGKKSIAEKSNYSTLLGETGHQQEEPTKIFHDVLNNVKPRVEVRSRRVGGATYQVPNEVKADRAQALAIRWIVEAARKRSGKSMQNKLYQEFLDASDNKGGAVKKREDTHKMADANKAFAHFRW